jgi:hypothetical protein
MLMRVTEIRPAADTDAAQWLLRSHVDWWHLVRYGPPGFDVYVRIALPQYSEADADDPSGEAPADAMRAVLATLGSYTTTPSRGYAAIWEGWVSGDLAPQAPRVEIPNRAMLLFTGPVEALRDAPRVAGRSSLVSGRRGRRRDRVHCGLFRGGGPGFDQSPAGRSATSALRGTGSAVPRPGLAPASARRQIRAFRLRHLLGSMAGVALQLTEICRASVVGSQMDRARTAALCPTSLEARRRANLGDIRSVGCSIYIWAEYHFSR